MTDKYRAVYIPQVPMKGITIEAPSLEKAAFALESMIHLSIFEYDNRVKPDYSDLAVIQQWDGDDWEDLEDEEWEHLFKDAGYVVGDTQ